MDPAKSALRQQVLAARRDRDATARADVAESLALHLLALPLMARARRVACHLSMAGEPGTGPLLEQLLARGTEVLVPVTAPGHRLDWVLLEAGAERTRSAIGVDEPTGPRLGPEALVTCRVVIVPALAVDLAGHRLGRGAGYYDRALADVTVPRCALVHACELVPEVPHEPHDVRVDLAVTETGVFRVP